MNGSRRLESFLSLHADTAMIRRERRALSGCAALCPNWRARARSGARDPQWVPGTIFKDGA
jgi:hypothetical protein